MKSGIKKILGIAFLFLATTLFGQRIYPPTFALSNVYFETAKMKSFDPVTKKYAPEVFKTANISITDADKARPIITLDIPDKIFFKESEVYSMEYSKDHDGSEGITYILVKGNMMASITFSYESLTETPEYISVWVTENYMAKPVKRKNYTLFEFK